MSRARPQQVKEFAQEEISANFAFMSASECEDTANLGSAPVWCCSVDAYGSLSGSHPERPAKFSQRRDLARVETASHSVRARSFRLRSGQALRSA